MCLRKRERKKGRKKSTISFCHNKVLSTRLNSWVIWTSCYSKRRFVFTLIYVLCSGESLYQILSSSKRMQKRAQRQVTCQYLLFSLRILLFWHLLFGCFCFVQQLWEKNLNLLIVCISSFVQYVICYPLLDSHLKSVPCSGSCFLFTILCTSFVISIELKFLHAVTSQVCLYCNRREKSECEIGTNREREREKEHRKKLY